jgi:23S rRNA pseudouridine1911/1915/1917 synthase
VRPGIVHRLDKDTTGLLVVAKDDKSMKLLQEEIKERKVKRQYVALLRGRLRVKTGRVAAPIGGDPAHRKKMAVVQNGRPAVTDYQVVARYGQEYTLVLAKLRTGRTLRFASTSPTPGAPGWPDILCTAGEKVNSGSRTSSSRYEAGLYRPKDGEYVEFSAPLPTTSAERCKPSSISTRRSYRSG